MSENNNQSLGDLFPDLGPEVPIISGVAHDNTESLATVRRVPNEPGMAAKVFTLLAEAGVNVDMIVQASASTGTADISFTVPGSAAAKVRDVLQEKQDELGYQSFDIDANVGKVAVVGVGMKTHSGLAAKFFNALSDEGVNVLMISTSEIRIAALVPLEQLNDAVKAPNRYRDAMRQAALTRELRQRCDHADSRAGEIMRWLDGIDAWRRPERLDPLLALIAHEAPALAKDLALAWRLASQILPQALLDEGLRGLQLGQELARRREQTIREALETA